VSAFKRHALRAETQGTPTQEPRMLTSVSSSYASSASYSLSTHSASPRPDAAAAFQQLDADNKGYLTQSDLESAIVNISAQGASQSLSDANTPGAADLFAQLDSDQSGQVSQDEFTAAAQATPDAAGNTPPPAPPAGARPSGPPPGGGKGPGGPGGPSGASGADTSTSTTTYDPADANEDGTVTQAEQQAYDDAQASSATNAASASSSDQTAAAKPGSKPSAQSSAAVQAYESVSLLTEAA
jgi:hypothetical protein